MTKSDDSRIKLEAEYRDAVKDFQSGMENILLDPDRIAELSDDDLKELIQRYGSSDAQPTELLQLEEEKTPRFFGKDKPEQQTKYDEYWIRYIVCAGAPLGTFIFLFFARRYGEQISLNLDSNAITSLMRDQPDNLLILSGRVTWAVFDALFYAAVCATAFAGIFYIIPKALEKHLKFNIIIFLMILIPIIAYGVGLYNNWFQIYLPIPRQLLSLTVNKDKAYGETGCYRFPFNYEPKPLIECKMENDELWVYATHAFLSFLCIIIIIAASQDTKHITEPGANLDRIERRLLLYMKLLRLSLYLGAAVLVTEILNVNALLHWPLAYLNTKGTAYGESVDSLISALITERAINYTGFLAILYIPAFLVFKADAYSVACRKLPGKSLADREAWLKQRGIAFSVWEYWPRAVAILGPVLSTPVSELMRRVLG